MKKTLTLGYGALSYALFFLSFLYLVGFLANVVVPRSVDHGNPLVGDPSDGTTLGMAVLVDVALVVLFGLQHSVMARSGFKRRWTRVVPPAIERSTYVLLASLILLVTFRVWRPIPIVVWSIASPAWTAVVWGAFAAGWGLVLVTTFVVDHFALFGMKQVVSYARGRPLPEAPLRISLFYRFIRHPLFLGFLTVFWATPEMTVGHLLYAGLMTAYVAIGIPLEERDLVRDHGQAYEQYRREIPMLLPRVGKGYRTRRGLADRGG